MRQQQQQQMSLSRQRLLTLVYDDMETVRMVRSPLPPTYTSTPRLMLYPPSFQTRSSYGPVYSIFDPPSLSSGIGT
jgi:hypothetical protein